MKTIADRIPRIPLALVVFACALLAVAASSAAEPAQAALPPRPTQTPVPAPKPPTSAGATIQLQVQFPGALSYPWQELWTVVQWQDEWGYWHDVQGWQGTLDEIAFEDGQALGQKTWWVGKGDLGKEPFRWLVYRSQGGYVLAMSQSFDLPDSASDMMAIEVSLAP